jgi:YggT family protein
VDAPLPLLRWAVFALVAVVGAGAAAAMAVQRRLINPFGAPARTVRRLTDPALKPIERRLLRAGRNPQSAPWWLLGSALVAGILAISVAEWLLGLAGAVGAAAASGPRTVVALAVDLAFNLLMLALIVRVIGSWLGATRWTPWMRPFHLATEWMLAPLRRVLPTMGPLDVSPLVAWLIINLLRSWILNAL